MQYKDKKEYDAAVKRIRSAERSLCRAKAAQARLVRALEGYECAAKNFDELEEYYGSDDWKRDFMADENGELPAALKKGVLSEDGVWELLEERNELSKRLYSLSQRIEK